MENQVWIDGEMSSAAMWEILQEIRRHTMFLDDRRFFFFFFSITRLGLRITNSNGCTDSNLPRRVDPPRCDVVIHRHGEDGAPGQVRATTGPKKLVISGVGVACMA